MDSSWHVDVDSSAERTSILDEVARLAPWYHSYRLADWLVIEGQHQGDEILLKLDRLGFPTDFSGEAVLDVGCSSGFYGFVAKTRGAERVVGVEVGSIFVEQGQFLSKLLGLEMEFIEADVHEIGPALGTFDTVICSGLLYHIADPTNVLLALSSVCDRTLLVESEFLQDPASTHMARFIEHEYMGDDSNWWIYGSACMEGMVRAVGFRRAEFRGFYVLPDGSSPEGIPKGGRGFLIATK